MTRTASLLILAASLLAQTSCGSSRARSGSFAPAITPKTPFPGTGTGLTASPTVDGNNVTYVSYSELFGGPVIGTIQKTGFWTERNPEGTFVFVERSRSHSSLTLYDDARKIELLLDLNNRKIYYSDSLGAINVEMYRIVYAANN